MHHRRHGERQAAHAAAVEEPQADKATVVGDAEVELQVMDEGEIASEVTADSVKATGEIAEEIFPCETGFHAVMMSLLLMRNIRGK